MQLVLSEADVDNLRELTIEINNLLDALEAQAARLEGRLQ